MTLGAYGRGDRPIITCRDHISGSELLSKWKKYSENIWYLYYGPYKIASRVWLSGKEYPKAKTLSEINSTYRWYFDYDNSLLYVYSESNPASYYSDIEESMAVADVTVLIRNESYITIEDLDLRGGRYTVEILGSDHITIENCNIGLDAGHIGIWVSGLPESKKTSNYGIIRNCVIDCGCRFRYYYEKAQTEDGIHLRDGANYWGIYENTIIDWGHTCIGLSQFDENMTVSYNVWGMSGSSERNEEFGRSVSEGTYPPVK